MKIIFWTVVFWAAAVLGLAWFAPAPAGARPTRDMTLATTPPAPLATSNAPFVATAASFPASNAPVPTLIAPGGGVPRQACGDAPAFADAAARNAADLYGLAWTPYGPSETGWRIYGPRIAVEIASDCAWQSSGFAGALAGWQQAHGRPPTGFMDSETFNIMKVLWHLQRQFVVLNRESGCPPPAAPGSLVAARPEELRGGRPMRLRADALAAYRHMVADARAADPAIASDPQALLIFSGYRSPTANAADCLLNGGCNNVSRAPCSAHRTGLAFDIVVGAAPGGGVASTDNANRLAQSQTPAYRWLVRNAHRYGFVNYVYEPWHWEWSPPKPPLAGIVASTRFAPPPA